MENNNTLTLINEGAIQDIIRSLFGKNFKSTVASAAEGALNKALTDVVSGGRKFTIAALRKKPEYIQAFKDLTLEASRVKYGKTYDDLVKFDKNAAQKLIDDVQTGIEKEISDKAATGKTLIDADVIAAQKNVKKVSDQVDLGKATPADLAAATKELNANVKMQTKWADTQKAIAGMDKLTVNKLQKLLVADAKVTTGTGTKIAGEVTSDAIIQTKTGIFKITKEQLKKFPGAIKKVVVNNKMLSTLAVAGLSVTALYYFFNSGGNSSIILTDENGNPIDDTTKVGGEWLPCIQQMIKSKEGRMVTTNSGQISVFVKTSEFPGGLQYYANGRVMNTATKDMGSYTCKEGTVTINEVVGRILRERLLKEQDTEISDETMDKYVDDAVDDLDGYVAGYNLKSLKDILTSLKGKTYKGEDAIKKFLEFYKQDEGVDFVTDVKSVGVANLSVVAKNMKPEIIALATGASSNVVKPDNSDKSGGNSGTTIIWDKDKKKGGGDSGGGNTGGGGKSGIYRDCENMDFPLSVGCRSTKIAEIQKCLGEKDDGRLGPLTMKAMVDNKYDTSQGLSKDVYNAILKACNPETKREKIEPITLAPRKGLNMTDIVRPDLKLNFNDIIRTPRKPTDLYKLFVDNGYIDADTGGTPLEDGTVLPSTRRVKYKGPELDDSILSQMDDIMSGMGYTRIKQKLDKKYSSKYVWLKN